MKITIEDSIVFSGPFYAVRAITGVKSIMAVFITSYDANEYLKALESQRFPYRFEVVVVKVS